MSLLLLFGTEGPIQPAGIGSAEAFGTAQLNRTLPVDAGITSAEAFGTPSAHSIIGPSAIASAEAFGTVQVNRTLPATGIGPAEAFGTAVVAGPITVPAIPSAEAHGTTAIVNGPTPDGIPSAEAFGAATVVLYLRPTAIAGAEAFGATSNIHRTLPARGILSEEKFGHTRVPDLADHFAYGTWGYGAATYGLNSRPNPTACGPESIASAEAFGAARPTHLVRPTPTIGTAEAFGTHRITLFLRLHRGIGSEEFVPRPSVHRILGPTAIGSSEAFGTARVNLVIFPAGAASAEAFGTAQLNLVIFPEGAASAEAFGTASAHMVIGGAGAIASAEDVPAGLKVNHGIPVESINEGAFGTPQVNLAIHAATIGAAEAFGTASVQFILQPAGIDDTGSQLGGPSVVQTIHLVAIDSEEAFGTLRHEQRITFTGLLPESGIESEEAFGNVYTHRAVLAHSVDPSEAFGTPTLVLLLLAEGIASAEAFGTPARTNFIFPTTFDGDEQFSSPRIQMYLLAESFTDPDAAGTPRVDMIVFPEGIASEEFFGGARPHVILRPRYIDSGEDFGDFTDLRLLALNLLRTFSFGGSAYGVRAYGPGRARDLIEPTTGIASAEAFGTPTLPILITVEPIGSAEDVGAEGVIVLNPNEHKYGGVAFGVTGFAMPLAPAGRKQTVRAAGAIAPAEAFGLPVVSLATGTQNIAPASLPLTEDFGLTVVSSTGASVVEVPAMPSAEEFGTAGLAVRVTVLFPFASSAEGFVGESTKLTLTFDPNRGDPSGSLSSDLSGRNQSGTGQWVWTGTWESLGVPANARITSIRLLGAATRCFVYQVANTSTVGPYRLQDAGGATLRTLWNGRTFSALDVAWVDTGAQPVQTLDNLPSGATIRLVLERSLATGNNKFAQIQVNDDRLNLEIAYIPVHKAIVPSIPSGESFGPVAVQQSGSAITAQAIGSLEAFGTLTVNRGPVSVGPFAIDTAQAFGTQALHRTAPMTGIASAEAFGAARVNHKLPSVGGIASAAAIGAHSITAPGSDIRPNAIGSAEAFGIIDPPRRTAPLAGIGSAEAFGQADVSSPSQSVPLQSILSAEAFGTARTQRTTHPVGIPTAEALGQPNTLRIITSTGIESAVALGVPTLRWLVRAATIASLEALGTPELPQENTLRPPSIPPAEAFGTPQAGDVQGLGESQTSARSPEHDTDTGMIAPTTGARSRDATTRVVNVGVTSDTGSPEPTTGSRSGVT